MSSTLPEIAREHTASPSLSTEPPKKTLKNRIFIGNLPPQITDYALLKLFEPFGKITALDLVFHKTGPLQGLPKGFAFIEFASDESAVEAIAKMHGKKLKIAQHSNKGRGAQRGGRGGYNSGHQQNDNPPPIRPLVVSYSIDPSATNDDSSSSQTPMNLSAGLNYSSASAPYGPRSSLSKPSSDHERKESRFSSFTSTDRGQYRGGHRGGGGPDRGYGRRDQQVQEAPKVVLKTNERLANASTETKIAALERQLRMLEEDR